MTAFTNKPLLPADVVFAPQWWHHNEGITFDRDYFFHPAKRVEVERKSDQALYRRWGKFGLGENKDKDLPVIGPVHLAAGYMLNEMLGCEVRYREDAPPQPIPANKSDLNISVDAAFRSPAFKDLLNLIETLEKKYGYVAGDVGWGGILNTALDIRGQQLFMDMVDKPEAVHSYLDKFAELSRKFVTYIHSKTHTSSISVNRNVRHLRPAVFLHSECSHTMIDTRHYEQFIFKYDAQWSKTLKPFGIHFCGKDPHRFAPAFARLPRLDFLDVGWGGKVAEIRQHLPNTFLNIRLSPVEITHQSTQQIADTIEKLVAESGNPRLTGVCCINMDEKVANEKVTAIFQTVWKLREKYSKTFD